MKHTSKLCDVINSMFPLNSYAAMANVYIHAVALIHHISDNIKELQAEILDSFLRKYGSAE